jgi:hypothetical protein
MSFSQRILKNVKTYLTKPTPRQEERLEYAQNFLDGLQMVTCVLRNNGYARDLDYDQINEEELLWLAREIRELPNPDYVDFDDARNLGDMMLLRDQAARSIFGDSLTEEKIIALPGQRKIENYF